MTITISDKATITSHFSMCQSSNNDYSWKPEIKYFYRLLYNDKHLALEENIEIFDEDFARVESKRNQEV